jgi:hypothetical protein
MGYSSQQDYKDNDWLPSRADCRYPHVSS